MNQTEIYKYDSKSMALFKNFFKIVFFSNRVAMGSKVYTFIRLRVYLVSELTRQFVLGEDPFLGPQVRHG